MSVTAHDVLQTAVDKLVDAACRTDGHRVNGVVKVRSDRLSEFVLREIATEVGRRSRKTVRVVRGRVSYGRDNNVYIELSLRID